MIVRQLVSGRQASVAYLTSSLEPATPDDYAIMKVIFDEGDIAFLMPESDGDAEARTFNRHRRRTYHPPPEIEGDEEAAAWSRHRHKHSSPYVVFVSEEDIQADDSKTLIDIADVPVKLQLTAWSEAIAALDASEVVVRDLIERALAGRTGASTVRAALKVLPITNELVEKIKYFRQEAFKTAFRQVRTRLGDVRLLGHSLATWAAAFAREDLNSIRTVIQAGLMEGLDSTEIARKVVGSMTMKGVDGVTEYTRHKLAHLGRAGIKAANLRNLRGE